MLPARSPSASQKRGNCDAGSRYTTTSAPGMKGKKYGPRYETSACRTTAATVKGNGIITTTPTEKAAKQRIKRLKAEVKALKVEKAKFRVAAAKYKAKYRVAKKSLHKVLDAWERYQAIEVKQQEQEFWAELRDECG